MMQKKFGILKSAAGYSLVGIVSIFFGLILGVFNKSHQAMDSYIHLYNELVEALSEQHLLIILIIINMIFISCIYVCYRKEDNLFSINNLPIIKAEHIKIYGIGINLIMLCIAMIFVPLSSDNQKLYFVIISLFYCFIFYNLAKIINNTNQSNDGKDKDKFERARYRLVLPSLLFVSLPIYIFAGLQESNQFTYTGLFILIVFCLFLFTVQRIQNSISESQTKFGIKDLYILFIIVVILFLIVDFKLETNPLASRTLLLSMVVALYLSIYEGWLIIFPLNAEGERVSTKFVKNIHNTVILLTILFPAIVSIIFFYQQAGTIYIISFSIVHLISQFVLITCVLIPRLKDSAKEIERRKRGKILRSLFGISVLFFLLCDKIVSIDSLFIENFDSCFLREFSQQLNIVIASLPIIITIPILDKIFYSAFTIIFTFTTKKDEIKERWGILSLQFLVCYLALLIIIIFVIPFTNEGDNDLVLKIFSSICLLLLFISVDIGLLYKEYIYTNDAIQSKM